MRDIIIGTVVVSAVGLGVFFFPAGSEPGKIYPLTEKQAVRKLDKPQATLSQIDFAGHRLYSTIATPRLVEFVDKKSGRGVICEAEFEREGDEGVTVEVSCPNVKDDTPMDRAKKAVAEITLMEMVDATLTDRPLDQVRVNNAFAQLDLSEVSKDDVRLLKRQSQVGNTPVDVGEGNRQRARDLYAKQYNSEGDGDGGWSTDAVFDAMDE